MKLIKTESQHKEMKKCSTEAGTLYPLQKYILTSKEFFLGYGM